MQGRNARRELTNVLMKVRVWHRGTKIPSTEFYCVTAVTGGGGGREGGRGAGATNVIAPTQFQDSTSAEANAYNRCANVHGQ